MNVGHVAPAPLRSAARRLPQSGLLLLTSICSLDGTLMMLAATGVLSTWAGVLVTGLTVVAGAGAWLAARAEFANRRLRADDVALLALLVTVGALAAAAAGALGAYVGSASVELRVLPRATGIVLLLLALEIGGVPLPRIARVPLAPLVLTAALVLEGAFRWIP